ncbi:MAG: 3-oxoacyl-[acyl-carrier-protein] reductase [Rhodospirillales bacterium]
MTGTAGPKGIGRAAALRLAREGAAVTVTDIAGTLEVEGGGRNKLDLLADLAAEIERAGGRALALEVDVTQAHDIRSCVQAAKAAHGRLDILVNNAGTTVGTGPFLDTTDADWERSFAVNLLGPMMFCRAVLPELEAGGSIVNIGSTGSLGAEAGFGAYTAMKHGVIGLTKTIAAEFGGAGIRCNAVCPGYTMTDMHEAVNRRLARDRDASVATIMAERYAGVALQRAGTPEEVAEVIAYLAGPASSYITGVALPVSGGTPVGL